MEYVISKNLTGLNHHLLHDENKNLINLETLPENNFYILGAPAKKTIEELANINNFSLPVFPPEKYKTMMSSLTTEEILPWNLILGQETFDKELKKYIENIDNFLDKRALFEYYENYYSVNSTLFEELKPAIIDRNKLIDYTVKDESLSNKEVLCSFIPGIDSKVKVPGYSQSTKTGRLKIVSGPNILRLKRDYRDIFISRFKDDGKIIYLDYKSLEPRVLLGINKSDEEIPQDIYQYVIDQLKIKDLTRSEIKTIVISQINGAGEDFILKQLGAKNIKLFIQMVNDFFGMEQIKSKLMEEWKSTNHKTINNYYGRVLDASAIKPYMLVNYYIQSTAVDVALIGFKKIINHLKETKLIENIVPIYVLHDALVLDVHKDYFIHLEKLQTIGAIIAKLKHIKFFMERSNFFNS